MPPWRLTALREAGGFELAQGLKGADAGVADHQEAFIRGDFIEAVFQGLLGEVEPAVAEEVDVGGDEILRRRRRLRMTKKSLLRNAHKIKTLGREIIFPAHRVGPEFYGSRRRSGCRRARGAAS